MAIKGIIFDLDGVYFSSGKEEFMRFLVKKYALSYEQVKNVFIRSQEMQRYKEGRMSGVQFWEYARTTWGIQTTTPELLTLLAQSYTVNHEARRIIRSLRKKGYKIIACSNNFKERISVLDKRFNFLNDFDVTVFSYREGLLKPELLHKVVQKTKLSSPEILFIDDQEHLIAAASSKGFATILCEDPSRIADYLKQVGVRI